MFREVLMLNRLAEGRGKWGEERGEVGGGGGGGWWGGRMLELVGWLRGLDGGRGEVAGGEGEGGGGGGGLQGKDIMVF